MDSPAGSGLAARAFVSHSDDENKVREDWAARNVTPVLYRDDDDHKYLHKTLRMGEHLSRRYQWQGTHRRRIRSISSPQEYASR